jgi:putative transcriptional regulator
MTMPRRAIITGAGLAAIVFLAVAKPVPSADRYAASIAGDFLVSSPSMTDQRFAETLIYMVNHDRDGAMGLVINRVLGRGTVKAYMKGLGLALGKASGEFTLHQGGPVQVDIGIALYDGADTGADTQAAGNGLRMAGHAAVLEAMAEGREIKDALFFLGYVGWGPGQLDRELAAGDWLTAPFDRTLLFDDDAPDQWQRARKQAGISL